MKKIGRVKLFCIKRLTCGVIDSFTVVVSEKLEKETIQKYKAMGYKVIRM